MYLRHRYIQFRERVNVLWNALSSIRLPALYDGLKLTLQTQPISPRGGYLLYRLNAQLMTATTEQTILGTIAQAVDKHATLRLIELERDSQGKIQAGEIIASRKRDRPWAADPVLHHRFLTRDYPALVDLDALGDPVVLVPDLNAQVVQYLPDRLLADERGLAIIQVFRRADGEPIVQALIVISWSTPHEFSATEEYVLRGTSGSLSVVLTNQRLYQAEKETSARLRELDAFKNQFLYSTSHELRTPLHGIIAGASLILEGITGEISDDVREEVQAILDSGEHLLTLITDILDIAKLESGEFKLHRERSNLRDPIEDAIRSIEPLFQKREGLSLQVDIPAQMPSVEIDCTRIRQVVLNLLSNAVKFTSQGSIRLQVLEKEHELVVAVTDEGIGIQPEDQAIIFEPFRQLKTGYEGKTQGTGLGLSVSRALIEKHGGRIWLESEPNHGSTFYFSLPIGAQQ